MRTAAEYFALGQEFLLQGNNKEAISALKKALKREPDNLPLWNQAGALFQQMGEWDEAAFCYRHIVHAAPAVPEASACLGNVLRAKGSLQDAAECFRRALQLRPDHAAFHNSLAVTLREQGLVEEAVAEYRAALALQPDQADVRWNLALLQLLEGNYAEGWRNYEARWQRPNAPRCFPGPLWRGEPLQPARILLHSEQGLGDTIQFLRYVPLVEAAGGEVILDLPPSLHSLAGHLVGDGNRRLSAGSPQDYDWQCPLMSLPLALGSTLETIPATVPYLRVPPEAGERAAGYPWPKDRLRIGLVWSGNPKNPGDRFRSIPLAEFQPLFDLPGVSFFSLQVGPGSQQIAAWSHKVTDLSEQVRELDGLAACMQQMDLVLTVDTLAAHLAGALGVPVLVLLAQISDWRWMRNREDSPWYPGLRLFRQTMGGAWREVFERVRSEIEVQAKKSNFPRS